MRRFRTLSSKLSANPPRSVQVAAIVVVAALVPICSTWGTSFWKQNWTTGAVAALGVYIFVVVCFVLGAFGITGPSITTKEQDKEIAERYRRFYRRYWWVPLTGCLLYIAYDLFKFYA
jgi:hypothetical protein